MNFDQIYKPKFIKFIKITILELALNPHIKYSSNNTSGLVEEESRLYKIIKKNKLDIDQGITQLVDKLFIKHKISQYINKIKYLIDKQIEDYEKSKKNSKNNLELVDIDSNNLSNSDGLDDLDDLEDESNIIDTHEYFVKEESDYLSDSDNSDNSINNQDDYEKEKELKFEFFNKIIGYVGLYQIFNLSTKEKENFEKKFYVLLDL